MVQAIPRPVAVQVVALAVLRVLVWALVVRAVAQAMPPDRVAVAVAVRAGLEVLRLLPQQATAVMVD